MAELANPGISAEESGSSEPPQEVTPIETPNGEVGQTDGGTKSVDDSNAQANNSNQEIMTSEGDGNETETGKDTEGAAKSAKKDGDYYAVTVANIPLTASVDDVRKHFEKKVTVKNVSLEYAPSGKYRGYATVELPDKSAYEGAIKIPSKLGTHYLYVMPHKSMPKPQEEEGKLYQMVVSNIPKSISMKEAKKHFYPAGLVSRFVPKIPSKSKRFGFCDGNWSALLKVNKLETLTNILRMDGSLLRGQRIHVQSLTDDVEEVCKSLGETGPSGAENKKRSNSDSQDWEGDESPFKIFVGNLSQTVNCKRVRDHLSQAGTVIGCWMPSKSSTRKRPRTAFVTFADEEGYKKALELHRTTLDGTVIDVFKASRSDDMAPQRKRKRWGQHGRSRRGAHKLTWQNLCHP